MQHGVVTNAQLDPWCVLTGEYYTGEYETWCFEVPESLTSWYFIDCETIPGYRTGGTYNESGDLVDAVRVEPVETWCVLTGQTLVPAYITGCYLTWWYWTWWTVVCDADDSLDTSDDQWEVVSTPISSEDTLVSLGNGVCESGDIVWVSPISWSVVRDIFSLRWAYSWTDCLMSWLFLQLRDHNNQWISLWTFTSGSVSTTFDSKSLYSFQQSGFYHIIGTNGSGQDYYIYTWTYTWTYSRLFTWYKVRLIDNDQIPVVETAMFTIDNESPTLTWILLASSWSTSGYLGSGGLVTLTFTASEELSWLQVRLWSGIAASTTISWLAYQYIRRLSPWYPEWNLPVTITFADAAGNTWALVYTSALVFDITSPIVTGFVFSEYTQWLQLSYSWLEATTYSFTYWISWWNMASGFTNEYLTAQQLSFSWIARDQLYTFALQIFDRVGNARSLTGDFTWTNLWTIVSHVYFVPLTSPFASNLSSLAVVLKAEVDKFNACKKKLTYTPIELEVRRNSFILQMPNFKKSQVKILVNAFTLFVLDKVKGDYTIAKSDIEDITKKFDNFLIILKFLRDDDNECKQNLSNYHITQFKRALNEYNISLE